MYIFAYVCLLGALLAALFGGGIALIQLWQKRQEQLALLNYVQWFMAACFFLASALLLHALFWQDYRLEYVTSYTDQYLPVFYRLTAFWAGQPGSMLFWALVTAGCGLIFSFSKMFKHIESGVLLWYWAFFFSIMAFFGLILTCWSNPFIMLQQPPADGNGLNPLLQNPGMIIHPPLLFLGYAIFTIPACLGLAQLLVPASLPWYRITRNYILGSWIFLTAGIILGAWWAYMELGWGGYWAWDPVENASLLPWLAGTATIHVLAVENSTGKLDRASVFLVCSTLISAFFATYLTRSGVIQSVHAFGDGGVGTPLLIFVISSFVIICIITAVSRREDQQLSAPFSREGLLVLTSWLFIALALIILIATIWPVLSKFTDNSPQGLDATFYNRVCLPLASFLLVILGICTWLGWKEGFKNSIALKKFLATCGAFASTALAIWFYGYRLPLPLITASASVAVLCAMSMHIFDRTVWQSRRAFCALWIHLGVALFALGVSFSGPYKIDSDLLLSKGQSGQAGPYTITLASVSDGPGNGYDFLKAELNIKLGNQNIGTLYPERRIYAKFGAMQFSEVDVISTLGEDIYASLLGMDEEFKVLVKISLEPMVNLLWIGGVIMCLLPICGMIFIRKKNYVTE